MIPDNFTGTVLAVMSSHTLKSAFKLIIKGLAPSNSYAHVKLKLHSLKGNHLMVKMDFHNIRDPS